MFVVANGPVPVVEGRCMLLNPSVDRKPVLASVEFHHLSVYTYLHGRYQVDKHRRGPGPYILLERRTALRTYPSDEGYILLCPSDIVIWMDQLEPEPVLAVLRAGPRIDCRARIRIPAQAIPPP